MTTTDPFISIRGTKNSGLENQRAAFTLLENTETSLSASGIPLTPVNYFTSLLPLLDDRERELKAKMDQKKAHSWNTSIIYLVGFIIPQLSKEYIRSNYSDIYVKLVNSLNRYDNDSLDSAPFIRPAITIIESVLIAHLSLESSAVSLDEYWIGERSSLGELLALLSGWAIHDGRPRVRKVAQESLATFVTCLLEIVKEDDDVIVCIMAPVLQSVLLALRSCSRREYRPSLHLLKCLPEILPPSAVPSLNELISSIIKCLEMGNEHLSAAVLSFIRNEVYSSSLLKKDPSSISDLIARLQEKQIIKAISSPDHPFCIGEEWILTVAHLAPHLNIELLVSLSIDFMTYVDVGGDRKLTEVVEDSLKSLFNNISTFSAMKTILSFLLSKLAANSVSDSFIRICGDICAETALADTNCGGIIEAGMAEIISLLGHLYDDVRKSKKNSADQEDANPGQALIKGSGAGGSNRTRTIEASLGKIISFVGPKVVLEILPLNLTASKPRAWLLPLLRDNVCGAELSIFSTSLLPEAEGLLEISNKHLSMNRVAESKVCLLVRQQIIATLPAFLMCSPDLLETLPTLAPTIAKLMNDEPDLRGILISSITSLAKKERSAAVPERLELLSSLSLNFLPLLLNIYGTFVTENREPILSCINSWILLSPTEERKRLQERIIARIYSILQTTSGSDELVSLLELIGVCHENDESGKVGRLCCDIVSKIDCLKKCCNSKRELMVTVLKRSYRLLSDLLGRSSSSSSSVDPSLMEELGKMLIEADEVSEDGAYSEVDSASASLDNYIQVHTKKSRFRLLHSLATTMSPSWIPSLLPEAVLATKEVNQQTRQLAFDLIILWARRMDSAAEQEIDGIRMALDEFLLMLLAGLAGRTPHMISATIMALARVFFEFKDSIISDLPPTILPSLLDDIITILSSKSREVVKSAIGFLKVGMTILPSETFESSLCRLVPQLLGWSNEHQQHFKVRVRHLIEKMVRRHGWSTVMQYTPSDHHALLHNIRKRRERLQRRKDEVLSSAAAASKDDKNEVNKKDVVATFESTIADSESDLEDDNDDDDVNVNVNDIKPKPKSNSTRTNIISKKNKKIDGGADCWSSTNSGSSSILHGMTGMEDDDEIDRILASKLNLASKIAKSDRKRSLAAINNGRSKHNYDDSDGDDGDGDDIEIGDDGRMIFREDGSDNTANDNASSENEEERRAPQQRRSKPEIKRKVVSRAGGKKTNVSYSYLPMSRISSSDNKKGKRKGSNGAGGAPTAAAKKRKYFMNH